MSKSLSPHLLIRYNRVQQLITAGKFNFALDSLVYLEKHITRNHDEYANLMNMFGAVYCFFGELDISNTFFLKSANLLIEKGDMNGYLIISDNLVRNFLRLKMYKHAICFIETLLIDYQEDLNGDLLYSMKLNLLDCYCKVGQRDLYDSMLKSYLHDYQKEDQVRVRLLNNYAFVLARKSQFKDAHELFEKALGLSAKLKYKRLYYILKVNQSIVYTKESKNEEGLEILKGCLLYAKEHSDTDMKMRVYIELVPICDTLGLSKASIKYQNALSKIKLKRKRECEIALKKLNKMGKS